MALAPTNLNPAEQVGAITTYTDTAAAGSGLEVTRAGGATLEDVVSSVISQINRILNATTGGNDWYVDINTPTALDTGSQRGVLDLNTDLHAIERKRILKRVNMVGVDVSIASAGDQYVILAAADIPSTTTAAVGSVTTAGTVVADASGSFGTAQLTEVTGANALQPKNLLILTDNADGDVVTRTSDGKQIYGLLQSENATDGFTITGSNPDRVQISFVVHNGTNDDLELIASGDMDSITFDYGYVRRDAFEDCPEEAWLGDGFTDTGAATITRQAAYDNQGAGTVTTTTNATLDIGTGFTWEIGDAASASILTITEDSGGGATDVAIGTAADTYNNNAVDVNFDNGVTVDNGSNAINMGVTANQIDFTGNATVTSTSGSTVTVGSTSANTTISTTTGGAVVFSSAGAIDGDASGAVTFDSSTAGISLDGVTSSNFTMTAATAVTETLTIEATNSGAGTGVIDVNADDDITIDSSSGAVSVDAAAASNFTVAGASLTLETTASGDVFVTAADTADINGSTVDIDAGTGGVLIDSTDTISLDAATASNFNVTAGNLTFGTGTSGSVLVDGTDGVEINSSGGALSIGNDADANAINVGTGAAARTITVGNATGATAVDLASGTGAVSVTSTNADTSELMSWSQTGTGGDTVTVHVGDSSPDGRVTAAVGSLFVDGAGPALWQNDDGATSWVQFDAAGATSLSSAVAAQGGTAFTAGAFNTQWGLTDGQFIEFGDSGNVGILTVSAAAGGDSVTVDLAETGGGATFDVTDGTNSLFTVTSVTGGDTLAMANLLTVDVDTSGAITMDSSGGGISLDANAASNFTVDSADLTLAATTSGDVAISSDVDVTVTASSGEVTIAATGGDANFDAYDTRRSSNLDLNANTPAAVQRNEFSRVSFENQDEGNLFTVYNGGYTLPTGTTGGRVNIINQGSSGADTVAGAGFTAGVAGSSDATVATTGASTFAANDYILITDTSGSTDPRNLGLFQVNGHSSFLLSLRGPLTAPQAGLEWMGQQFATDATTGADITHVNISILRTTSAGDWEIAENEGNGAPTFSSLSTTGTLAAAVADTGSTSATMDQGFTWNISAGDSLAFEDGGGGNILALSHSAGGDRSVTINGEAASSFSVAGAALTLETTTAGNLTVTAADTLDMDGSTVDIDGGTGGVLIDSTDTVSIDANAASNFTVTGANLDLVTVTTGDVNVTAADVVDVDGTDVEIDGSTSVSLEAGASGTVNVGADAIGKTVNIATATAGGGGTTVNVGNAGADTAVNIDSGSGDVAIESASGDVTITTAAGSETAGTGDWSVSFPTKYTLSADNTDRDAATAPGRLRNEATFASFENGTEGNLAVNFNTGYTTASGTDTFQVTVVSGSLTTDTITAFTNNGAASNVTATTSASGTFAAGDMLLVTGGTEEENKGVWEVVSHSGTTLTLAASPTAGAEFVNQQGTTTTGDSATATVVTVSVLRVDSSGNYAVSEGFANVSGISYVDLGANAATLEAAWSNATGAGATLATSFTGSITDGDTYLVDSVTGSHTILSLAALAAGDTVTIGDTGDASSNFNVDTASNTFNAGAVFDNAAAGTAIRIGLDATGGTANAIYATGGALVVGSSNASSDVTLETADSATTVGTLNLNSGSATTGVTAGGDIDVSSGSASGAAASGTITIQTAAANATANASSGGLILRTGTNSDTADVTSGNLTLETGGSGLTAAGESGDVNISTGSIGGDVKGGNVTVTAGGRTLAGTGAAGDISLVQATSNIDSGDASSVGGITITTSTNVGDAVAGAFTVNMGDNSGGGSAGTMTFNGGDATGAAGNGSSIVFVPGSGTDANGVVTVDSALGLSDAVLRLDRADGTSGVAIDLFNGSVDPESNVTGDQGDLYFRDGGADGNEVVYVKGSGDGTSTGWEALQTVSGAVTRQHFQDTMSSTISGGSSITDSDVTGGSLPTKPSANFSFDTDAEIYLNGILLFNGSGNEVTSGTGTNIDVEAAGPTFTSGDVISIIYYTNSVAG